MTLAELVQDVMSRLAEESDAYFDEATVKRWINEGERTIVRQTRVLQDIAETPTIAGRSEYPLPNWFWLPRLVKYDGGVLRPIDLERMERVSTSGPPTHFSVWRRTIFLHPAPVQSMRLLRVFFYAWPRGMREDSDRPDIPEAFHGLLATWATYRAKMADQSVGEAQALLNEFRHGVMELTQADAEEQAQENVVRDVWQPEGLF